MDRDWYCEINGAARHLRDRPRARLQLRADDLLFPLVEKYRPSRRLHNYHPHYWRHFRDIRLAVRKVVEIGVFQENSLRLWEEFFPNAEIFGLDIDPRCAAFAGGRRRVFIGDQGDPEFLGRFIEETGGDFDVVIDDGAHTEGAIMTSLRYLLPTMQPHGLYAIEDLINLERLTGYLARLAIDINYYPDDVAAQDWPFLTALPHGSWLQRHITSIAFYRFLCIIQRGLNPEDNPYLRRPDEPKI